jgi:hypothetical protein
VVRRLGGQLGMGEEAHGAKPVIKRHDNDTRLLPPCNQTMTGKRVSCDQPGAHTFRKRQSSEEEIGTI